MKFGRRLESESHTEDPPLAEPLPHHLFWIVLEDREMALQHLSEWPIGDAAPVGEAATGITNRLRGLQRELLPESADEARLPNTGIPDDRDEVRLTPIHRAALRGLQEL